MKILVTGARGFVGKNLSFRLKEIVEGKDPDHKNLHIEEIYLCGRDTSFEQLDAWCRNCDFVFHLAGVNRPKDEREFMEGNFGFTDTLLKLLQKHKNNCPVMLASSIQATLIGRYGSSGYGRSKLAGEKLLFEHEKETGARVLVYRFPNLFGRWCRPNYNSVIATFCHNVANDLPIRVDNRDTELEMLYIDDLVDEMLLALEGMESHCNYEGLTPVFCAEGHYCGVKTTHKVTLGEIVDLLHNYKEETGKMQYPDNSFARKLYDTYLSYLPEKSE